MQIVLSLGNIREITVQHNICQKDNKMQRNLFYMHTHMPSVSPSTNKKHTYTYKEIIILNNSLIIYNNIEVNKDKADFN